MTYNETLEFLYTRLAAFHRIGTAAYKPGLETIRRLCAIMGNPQKRLKCIHIAGTNGKGSTAHTIAAVLTAAGYKTGLYTSPHLLDFNERIRIDGQPIGHNDVIRFVEHFRTLDPEECGDPSFFELATALALKHFARNNVDYAVIEVGLGGRLDSTNIVNPVLSVITNISLDHTSILGDTRAEIAYEKAGIFKKDIPAVIGESDPEIRPVFQNVATATGTPLVFAEEQTPIRSCTAIPGEITYRTTAYGTLHSVLTGNCQIHNATTILVAIDTLIGLGLNISLENVREGFSHVCELTGLMGRWMKISDSPLTICDTGHNPGAWQYLGPHIAAMPGPRHIVLGFMSDKDIHHIMDHMDRDARYYFVRPSTPRAASPEQISTYAAGCGLQGMPFNSVIDGYMQAKSDALKSGGSIFVGGSTFVVSEVLEHIK